MLDVCAGGGVQGLSAARRYAARVTFVDASARAVRFARFNLALNAAALLDPALGATPRALREATRLVERATSQSCGVQNETP